MHLTIIDSFCRKHLSKWKISKRKSHKQITGIENSFVAADNIEYAWENKIPLWLFGFQYSIIPTPFFPPTTKVELKFPTCQRQYCRMIQRYSVYILYIIGI